MYYIGKIDRRMLENEFGIINNENVILTDERKQHIKEKHGIDYGLFVQHAENILKFPDIILKDNKNIHTVFILKYIKNIYMNIVVKLSLTGDDKRPDHSIMTAYRIREKNLKKLIERNETIYKTQ